MNREALRLLDEMYQTAFQGFASQFLAPDGFNDTYDQLRALLSAQVDGVEFRCHNCGELIAMRINMRGELAKQEANCTASDDTPSKSRAKRIEKQTEAPQ